MPERPGQWELLDHPSDPIIADIAAIDSRLAHFRALAESMRVEGQRLSAIASGAALKGQYADKLRSASGEVSKDIAQVAGRYEAVVQAITTYQPLVEIALAESASALDDAIDASGAVGGANAMPTATALDPSSPLTPQQVQANADKASATAAASGQLAAAKAKLAAVLSNLNDAGRQAASTVRGGFNDGLADSGWDRFKYVFAKFLKILVKVLTYIGMALAVLALVIPGLGEAIAAAGMAMAAVLLVANVALKAMGEGSWAEIGIAAAGLFTFGAARVLGPMIQSGLRSAMGAVRGATASGASAAEEAGASIVSTVSEDAEGAGDSLVSGVNEEAAETETSVVEETDTSVVEETAGEEAAGEEGLVQEEEEEVTEEQTQALEFLPRQFKPQAGSMIFKFKGEGEDLKLLREDPETGAQQFRVVRTGEDVQYDPDENSLTKLDGSPADFLRFKGDLPTEYFNVRGFEGQSLPKVQSLEELNGLQDATPRLVPTRLLTHELRETLEQPRVESIEAAFREGKALPPVALRRGDLTIDQGNHRLAAARSLGLPFVPVIVS